MKTVYHPYGAFALVVTLSFSSGYPINHFLQKDLSQSTIYYHHKGRDVFDDFFEVVLSDVHDPPNLSESQVGKRRTSLHDGFWEARVAARLGRTE